MAKGQVTEEELSKGIQGMGSMSALSPNKPKRDSPFRDTRDSEPKPASKETKEVREVRLNPSPSAEPKLEERPSSMADGQSPVRQSLGRTPLVARSVPPRPRVEESMLEKDIPTKAEVYSERVTVPLSSEMKVQLDLLAKELQKIRPAKRERITANTLVRVAIAAFLESFQTTPISSEEELLEVVRMRLGIKRS